MTPLFDVGDVHVGRLAEYVVGCRLSRPPANYFDAHLIQDLATAYARLADDNHCRAIVLYSQGDHFCAGANLAITGTSTGPGLPAVAEQDNPLYLAAVELFKVKQPVVAAVQGAAIGGGFGLALSADFRVGSVATRMAANFVKLGFIPGFGLTHTLPRLLGERTAMEIFLSGRRIKGEEAAQLGLLDELVEADAVLPAAVAMAESFAANAPLAVQSVKQALKADLAEQVLAATRRENAQQWQLQTTADFAEGVQAVAERRPGRFKGC